MQNKENPWLQRMAVPAVAACFALLFVCVAIISGLHGFFFQVSGSLLLLTIFLGSAYPFAAFLLGRGTNAILFTFPIGYILHALFLSFAGALFGITSLTLIFYFALFAAAAFLFHRKYNASSESRIWSKSDFWILIAWLFSAVIVVAIPFIRVGQPVEAGAAYRAYFSTDFFRHMAVSTGLANQGIPPTNPYYCGTVLRYYWFFHIIPAYWLKLFPSYSLDYLMVQFNLFVALMFTGTLYATVHHFTNRKRTLILILPLFLFGGSYEGLYLMFHFVSKNLPWMFFREWNVDAVLRWLWGAPQVDALFRAMLYSPQHLIGLAFFVLFLIVWKTASTLGRRMFLYFLLFTVAGFTVIIAGALIAGCAVILLIEAYREPHRKWKELVLSAVVGLAFLCVFLFVFQMFGTKAGEVKFEVNYRVLKNILGFFPLNWGAILIAGIAGIFVHTKRIPATTLLLYLALCFLFIIFINIDVPGFSEITLKMGLLSYVILLIFAADFFDTTSLRTSVLSCFLALLLIPALLTWAMDWYNNQDISNSKFTTVVSKDDLTVYRWMRKNVEKRACVQNYSIAGEGFLAEYVTETPAMGERPVYLGDKVHSRLYQISQEEVDVREKVVWRLFHLDATGHISAVAQRAGIDYIWMPSRDQLKHFEAHLMEPYFQLARKAGNARLYRVVEKKLLPIDMERHVLLQDVDGEIMLEAYYRDGFFDPEMRSGMETARWMNKEGIIELIASKRMNGAFSFNAYSEPYRRQIEVWLNGKLAGGERAKIRGIEVNVKLQLLKGKNILHLREAENYPGKKGPTEADRTGRIFMIENLYFSPVWR